MSLWSSMRRPSLATVLGLAWFLSTGIAFAGEREIFVDLDHARIVRVPEGAQTLVVGNPLIADVTMLRNNKLMVITGKSFGSTNLVVLDQTGTQVGESVISVVQSNAKLVVHRGPHRESYSCRPDCLPTIELGDDQAYLTTALGKITAYESSSSPRKK